jgi:hypothetical protein
METATKVVVSVAIGLGYAVVVSKLQNKLFDTLDDKLTLRNAKRTDQEVVYNVTTLPA